MTTETANLPYDLVPCPEPGSAEWLETRQHGIGGSDAAAIMGLNPYRSPLDVWMDKTGRSTEQESNRAMRKGTFMEPFILAEYEAETGRKGYKPTEMFRAKDYPWLCGNLDWLSEGHDVLADAKCSDSPSLWGEAGTDEIPEHYFIQLQCYMLITKVPVSEMPVLLPRNELRVFSVEENHEIQQRIIEATGTFWEKHVKTDTPPPIETISENSLSSVKRLYQKVEPVTISLPDPLSITVEKHLGLKSQIKGLQSECDSLQAIILSHIGDAERAEIPGRYTFTRTVIQKKPYTVTPKPYTTLKIKEIKDEQL